MTRAQAKALLEAGVLQAWAAGKTIQFRKISGLTDWTDTINNPLYGPVFGYSLIEWRVKPTPREWWVVAGNAMEDYDKALAYGHRIEREVVHVIEKL